MPLIALSRVSILAGAAAGGGAALPADNCTIGFLDYNDDGLASIAHTGGNDTPITNNANGGSTNKLFPPIGITDVWDDVADEFDWTELKLGDMVDIRLVLEVTTSSANQEVTLELELAQGGSPYRVPFAHLFYKTSGLKKVGSFTGIYMGDTNTLDNPGQFIFTSANDASIKVIGWYCKVLIRG